MDAVMARRIEDRFKPSRAAINRFGVDPELINQIDPSSDGNEGRMEAEHDQGPADHNQACERSKPRLAERCRQVVMLARMVGDMLHPEPAHAVRETVLPIIDEIIEHEDNNEAPPGGWHRHHAIGPDQHHDPNRRHAGQRADNRIAQSHRHAGDRVSRLIAAFGAAAFNRPPFDSNG